MVVIPAVGVSIGIERILTLLEEQAELDGSNKQSYIQVLVGSAGKDLIIHKMRLSAELWSAGIAAEFLYNKDPKPAKQLEYALEHRIPIVLMIGEDEITNNIVGLREIAAKTQINVSRDNIVSEVKRVLANPSPSAIDNTTQSNTDQSHVINVQQKLNTTNIK